MSKTADDKILELVKPEYRKKIPAPFRKHATANTCRLIEREHADLYAEFENDPVADEAKQKMSQIINEIFEQRMKKHNML